MDKENYETYEYLPASENNAETEPYQFFVVQDDGTFLINRQVQYVTQVQDAKEVLEGEGGQTCTMLDVAPQQFFVDIDNTTEMISVPDQFNIPEGTSNLYTSSYLLQPQTPVEQIENNAEELKINLQADNTLAESKQVTNANNNFTEITLTDAQYHVLEQKGWILLETNEKVYVLDTLGLHDITNNEKLIHKLKTEDATPNVATQPCQLNPSTLNEMDVELNCAEDDTRLEQVTALPVVTDDKKGQQIESSQWEEKTITDTTDANTGLVENLYQGVCENWKDENVLKIRTDFCLKDIPDKIVLGKTINGKRLVCKIIKQDNNVVKETQNQEPEMEIAPIVDALHPKVGEDKLDTIFRMCFTENTVKYNMDDVNFARKVIHQLRRLPAVKPALTNRNVLVTKVVVSHEDSNLIESTPTLVTGEVMTIDRQLRFVHKPDLYETAKSELSQALEEIVGVDHNFLHIHVHEIRLQDIVRTSVTLNKRRLELSSTRHSEKIFIPDLPLNAATDEQPENTMYGYACGICAAIFRSEQELSDHRETHKFEPEEKLTIDTREENYNKNGIMVLADPFKKTKMYACVQCNAQFQRLNNCQRHVKTHMAPEASEPPNDKKRVYKCKICYSFFHHAPTLLKHIMKNHIKVDK